MKRNKKQRQEELKQTISESPFITDEELAELFQVSVQTIRLDRLELSIPELRERIRSVATNQFDDIRSLTEEDVIGEVIDLQLDENAISILDITNQMVFTRNKIARGHYLFAQANSLAVAIINDELALTESASIKFTRQVHSGERVIAKAKATQYNQDRTTVNVKSYVEKELVFEGEFVMYRSNTSTKDDKQ